MTTSKLNIIAGIFHDREEYKVLSDLEKRMGIKFTWIYDPRDLTKTIRSKKHDVVIVAEDHSVKGDSQPEEWLADFPVEEIPLLLLSPTPPNGRFKSKSPYFDCCPWPTSVENILFRINYLLKIKEQLRFYKSKTRPSDLKNKIDKNEKLKEELDKRTGQLVNEITDYLGINLLYSQSGKHFDKKETFISELINTIPVPIFYKDQNGIYLECNIAFEQFIGKSRKSILGRTVFDIIDIEQAQMLHQQDMELFTGSGALDIEKEIKYHDGSFRSVLIKKRRIAVQDDGYGIIGILWDVTEIRQNELLLKAKFAIDYLSSLKKGLKYTLQQLLNLVFELTWVDIGGIYLFDKKKQFLNLEVQKGLPEELREKMNRYPVDSPQVKQVLSKKIYYGPFANLVKSIGSDNFPQLFRGIAVIPLTDKEKNEVIGSLNLASYNFQTVSTGDKKNFEAIAKRIIFLIKYARTQEKLSALLLDLENRVNERTKELLEVNVLLKNEIKKQQDTASALKYSEKLYRGIFENVQDGIVLYDAKTVKIIDLNNRVYNDLGYTKKEFLELQTDDFTVYASKGEREKYLQTLFEKGSVEYFVKHKTKKGKIRYRQVNESLLTINRKKYILGTLHDITNLKEKELAIRASEKKHKELQDNIPVGIFTTTPEGNITFLNRYLIDLLGIDPSEDYTCYNARDFYANKKDRGIILEHLEKYGEIKDYELKAKPVNKAPFWIKISINLVRDKKGDPLQLDGTIEDISVRKRSEKAAEKANKKVKETIKTLQDKVSDALKQHDKQQSMLVQKSKLESLGELAAGIAHEINQPLGIMSMSFENLQSKIKKGYATPVYLDQKFNSIDENISRIRNIIDHIRIFSREHELPTLDKVNLNKIVKKALSLIQVQYKNHDIHIKLHLQDKMGFTVGNNIKMEQAILNLLSNSKYAVEDKAIFEGEAMYNKEIKITTRAKAKTIHLIIHDNGVGIKKENLDRVFDPFFTTKPEGAGTGLGLSIVYGIIKEMRGEIKVKSIPAQYTNFEIILPRFPEND